MHAVAARPGFVRTAHGLTVMPSLVGTSADTVHARRVRELDRFVVPGLNEHDAAMPVVRAVTALAPAVRPSYPHRDAPERFGLEPIIEDLARTSDRMTAQFALRRLEYRSANITLGGAAFPWAAVPVFLGSALVGVLGAVAIGRLIVNRSRQVRVPIERKALAAEPSRVPHVTAATADGQSGR